jgi:hypothetical protein
LALEDFDNPYPTQFESGLILYIGTIIRKKEYLNSRILTKSYNAVPRSALILIGGDSPDIQTGSHSTWQLLEQDFNTTDLEK